ncbi:MAG: CBS domain-containing protein [Planctomycetota bacterium]|jgi:CBS domain-containing protein
MSEISEIMTSDVITVTPDTLIFDAIEILVNHNFTGLPVTDAQGGLVGIVTDKDLLRFTYDLEKCPFDADNPKIVRNVMNEDIAYFDINDPLDGLVRCLMDSRFRRVPILSDGKVVGIISRSDLIAYKLAKYRAATAIG